MTQQPLDSTEVAGRIEDLYGAPLADLQAHAQNGPPGMLAALLGIHSQLAFAEQSIAFHRERLLHLVHPDRQFTSHDAPHVVDCARRLAEGIAVHAAQSQTAAAVLQSLVRTSAPAPTTASAVPSPPVTAAHTSPSR
ncbi:hypothetical protein ACIO3O_08230 [Streptomyces sp. NPDC087440]|uniref:hypothetical protein n=1 Tax=Streptomyces sp. NPDC087440 TaxID=3365790 RepID=UPI00381D5499